MKILFFNEFSSIPGGTENVSLAELKYLYSAGIQVKSFSFFNKEIIKLGIGGKISVTFRVLLGRYLIKEFQDIINIYKPDIIHFHNIYPLCGTPIWSRIDPCGAEMILHLHNFYPLCLNSFCYNNNYCTKCIVSNSWIPGIIKKCKDHSLSRSVFCSFRISPHKWIEELKRVSALIAVSEYLRKQYLSAGVPSEKIFTINNPVENNCPRGIRKNEHVFFLGNIRKEKGIEFFCKAAADNPGLKFIAAGEGIDKEYYMNKYSALNNLHFTGYVEGKLKEELLRKAGFLVVPSLCPETFSLAAVEAFIFGVPVLTTGSGALKDHIIPGITGRITDINNLSTAVKQFWIEVSSDSGYSMNCMEFAKRFKPENHVSRLLELYKMLATS